MKHIDPSEINIINYLSGEMNNEEMKQFELQLEENQLLKTQVEEMREVQNNIGIWRDGDIDIPTFEPTKAKSHAFHKSHNLGFGKIRFTNWMKYAAAFIGFVLMFQILGLEVNRNGNTLMLSFGEPNSEYMDASDVDVLVDRAISKYASDQNAKMAVFENQLNSELATLSSAVNDMNSKNEFNRSQLESLFNHNMDGQYVRLESMIRGIEDNQRQELEDSFTGFMEYIENKRIKDQYKIQNAFSEIATAINDQQFQTNALLTSMTEEEPVLKSY